MHVGDNTQQSVIGLSQQREKKRDCEEDRESAMLMWKESNVVMQCLCPIGMAAAR